MSYQKFDDRFRGVRLQHNVLALVGNGFDLQALRDLESPFLTRYESFFHYLKFCNFDDANLIFMKMDELRVTGAANWSDVENAIGELVEGESKSTELVAASLRNIQREFSNFLDSIATPDVLTSLGERAVASRSTITSFTDFLGDIADADEYQKMCLPERLDIGDLFNFQFVNLNYTTLLDDFVYLDQDQFDPHPFKQSDRNVDFHPNPRGHPNAKEDSSFRMVSYLVTNVAHPHGVQYVPRSLLFGLDSGVGQTVKLTKPYWAQNEVKFKTLFAETDLFIVFGCSLGQSDGWWWRNILTSLDAKDQVDLIIYWRRGRLETDITAQEIRSRFAEAAGKVDGVDVADVLSRKARIVLYDDCTERAWLNTNPETLPNWRN